jgi:hypothetical protein
MEGKAFSPWADPAKGGELPILRSNGNLKVSSFPRPTPGRLKSSTTYTTCPWKTKVFLYISKTPGAFVIAQLTGLC